MLTILGQKFRWEKICVPLRFELALSSTAPLTNESLNEDAWVADSTFATMFIFCDAFLCLGFVRDELFLSLYSFQIFWINLSSI